MQKPPQQQQNQKRVVLISRIGHGKTTIFNKCCNKNLLTTAGGQSVTRSAFSCNSAYGNGFLMLDTPGIGSWNDKLGHVVGIASAFAEGPVNMILIIVKFARSDEIKSILLPMLHMQFKKFLNIITLAISCWDHLESDYKMNDQQGNAKIENNARKEIELIIKQFGIKQFITVSKQDCGQSICSKIDSILEQQKEINLNYQITPSEIQTYFQVIPLNDELQFQLNMAKEEVTEQFSKLSKTASIFIQKFDDKNPLLADIMHAMCTEIKSKAAQMIEEFQKQNMELFNQLYQSVKDERLVYLVDAELKCALIGDINKVVQAAQTKMLNNNLHCYNFIKKCPQCKEAWLKVDGCDGDITCGAFPKRDDDFMRFQVVPRKMKISINEKGVEYILQSEQKNIKEIFELGGFRYREKGCRYTSKWSEFIQLSQQELKELTDAGILDFLSMTVSQEKYRQSEMSSQQIGEKLKNAKVQKLN